MIVQVLMVVLTLGGATAGVAAGQPELLSEPWTVQDRSPPWPSSREAVVVDRWRERKATAKPEPCEPDASASEPQASTPVSEPVSWVRPVREIVDPWPPRPASWVPASEVIVDPWADP